MKKSKKTKVVEKKLGRHSQDGYNVFGYALMDSNKILIDPRQKGRSYMDTIIHEKLHLLFPEWSEHKVIKASRELSSLLWSQSYRRVDNSR